MYDSSWSSIVFKFAIKFQFRLGRHCRRQSFIRYHPNIVRRATLSRNKEDRELKEMRKVEDYVKDLRKDVDKRFSDLNEQLGPVKRRAVKAVSEKPLLALGVAFVLGFAVGIALSKSKD